MKKKNIYHKKLLTKGQKFIPGGSLLFSKKSEVFLPGKWPTYYSKAKGCNVWDMNKLKYLDMYFGVGTNTLGYANSEVDRAVINRVNKSNMSTLNNYQEVELAEKLIQMHKWADMAWFARSGGEANAIAIRIARAASRKDKIAICGYHGWHDWYLSVNLNSSNSLKNHLLDGLTSDGIPKGLKNTVFPFNYNDYEALLDLTNKHDIGTIKMEVSRSNKPNKEFLKKVRKLTKEKNIILIFDECTSGFRESYGGLHLNYGIDPDLAMFGKALGNGYAITSVIGRREIMEVVRNTFISSTFWTEGIGPAAAIETLKIMKRDKSWKYISKLGKNIKSQWKQLAANNNLNIIINGLDALPSFNFPYDNFLKYKTYITQELLKNKILGSNLIFVSMAHSNKNIDKYFEVLNKIFLMIQKFEDGLDVNKYLETEICQSGFKRLN